MADVPPLADDAKAQPANSQQANASPQNPEDGALGFQNAAKPHEEKYNTRYLTSHLVKNENKHRMVILGVVAAALLGTALWFVLMPQGKAPVPVEVDSATVTEADTANEAGAEPMEAAEDEIDK